MVGGGQAGQQQPACHQVQGVQGRGAPEHGGPVAFARGTRPREDRQRRPDRQQHGGDGHRLDTVIAGNGDGQPPVRRPGHGRERGTVGPPEGDATGAGGFAGDEDGGAEAGTVLWCESEGNSAENLRRINDWGIDQGKIIMPLDGQTSVRLDDPEHLQTIREIGLLDEVSMLVFDSFSAGFSGEENTNAALAPMQRLSEIVTELRKPLILIHHLRKKGAGDATAKITLDDIRGHSSIPQLPRSILALTRPDPEQEDARRLEVIKHNLCTKPEPLGFTFGEGGRITFTDSVPSIPRPQTKLQEATDFLRDRLRSGPLSEAAIRAEAEGRGIRIRTLHRAKADLGIVSVKDGTGAWTWGLRFRAF